MLNQIISGLKIPPHTAYVVETGTIDAPEKIAFFLQDYNTVDGELADTLTNFNEFISAGFIHVATLHIDLVNNTVTLVHVNPAKGNAILDFRANQTLLY